MCRGVDVCCFGRNQTGFRPKQHTSTPDAGDSTGEVGHETVMIDGQCDVYAGHGRVDEAGRIADGAAACAVEIARLRLDLHRQIEAFHQTWIQCDGRGKGIMQWHACREETRIRMKIRCDRNRRYRQGTSVRRSAQPAGATVRSRRFPADTGV